MIDIIDYNNDSSQFEKFVNASSKSGKKNKDVLYRQHCYYFRMINLLPSVSIVNFEQVCAAWVVRANSNGPVLQDSKGYDGYSTFVRKLHHGRKQIIINKIFRQVFRRQLTCEQNLP